MSGSEQNNSIQRLEPKHLYEKRIQRDTSRLKAYNQILSQIQNRIYHTSTLSESANYIMYTVPPFVLGLPSIDLEDCIVYLVHMLRQNGFVVKFTYPNLLYISWKHYESQYNKEHNPITQAMKPPAPAVNSSKKGAGGKRGMGQDSTKKVVFAPDLARIGGPGTAGPRSAAEYKPPDTFLEGIQRPVKPPAGNTTDSVLADLWKF